METTETGPIAQAPGSSRSPNRKSVAVIGGGAAGLMAAIFAASEGADTTLIERTADGGRKILISGGGRCNVLPGHLTESRFVTDSSPNTLRKMLRSWPLAEQRTFFEHDMNIPLAEERETGKLFPVSNRARDVRDGLVAMAEQRGVRMMMNTAISDIARDDTRDPVAWLVHRTGGEPMSFDAVIVATGGLSVPATGSDGTGLSILRTLGHTIHRTYAALTPLTAVPAPFADLSGVSLTVTISATSDVRAASSSGGFLFTHRGYSGPSVLDVSHVAVRSADDGAEPPARVTMRWSKLGDAEWEAELQASGSRTVGGAVRAHMPDRLAAALIARAGIVASTSLAELKRADRLRLVNELVRGELPWTGHEGYKKAEVTGGGVSLSEVDPRTMESRLQPGLFLCGEVLDAFGPIGGYNFCWAWATGRAAGRGAARIT